MFKGADMTTNQTAMQQNTVLLCCNPVEHDKVSQMVFLKCIMIRSFSMSVFRFSVFQFKLWADLMVSWHHKKVSDND